MGPEYIDPATALVIAAIFWMVWAKIAAFERREVRLAREEAEKAEVDS